MAEDQPTTWNTRYWQWLNYVVEVVRTVDSGGMIPLGPSPAPLVPPSVAAASGQAVEVVYCAPHPDDEALSGALTLRLRLETGARVTNVAVTLGSDAGQKTRRLRELECACRALGFALVVPATSAGPLGFDDVNTKSRHDLPKEWAEKVQTLREIFDREKPHVVFAPHAEDFNSTHIGTHLLVVDALRAHLAGAGRAPLPLIQTELWHQLAEPNLMVGVTPELVAIQLVAATEHGGEMTRNPYHLRHACRLMDNVRRGSEVVGGQGKAAQAFPLAELYRIAFVTGDGLTDPRPGGRIIRPKDKIDLGELNEQFRP